MAYTEVKQSKGKKYYYRVRTIREGARFRKERIYMGPELCGNKLLDAEINADRKLMKDKIEKGLEDIRPKIISVLKKRGIMKAGIFGSYARGEQKKDSDVDILISPAKGMGFGFSGVEMELEKKLKRKVDLVSYNGISPYLKDRILREEVRIL